MEILKEYWDIVPTVAVLDAVAVLSVTKRIRKNQGKPDKVDWNALIFFLLAGIATAQIGLQIRSNNHVDPVHEVANQLDEQGRRIEHEPYLSDKSKTVIDTIKSFKNGYLEMPIENSLVRENVSLANTARRRIEILDLHPKELLQDDYRAVQTALINAAVRGTDVVRYMVGPRASACDDALLKKLTALDKMKSLSIAQHFTEVFVDQDNFKAESEARYVQDDILFLYDGDQTETAAILLVASPGYSGLDRMRISWALSSAADSSDRLSGFNNQDDVKRRLLIEKFRRRLTNSPFDFVMCNK